MDFSGLDKLIPSGLKPLLFNLSTTGCFFYVDLFFLKRQWFDDSPSHIPIIFSLVMSLCWYTGNYISNLVSIISYGKLDGNTENYAYKVYLYSVAFLILPTVISIYFRWTFNYFFYFCCLTLFLRFIIGVILWIWKKKSTN